MLNQQRRVTQSTTSTMLFYAAPAINCLPAYPKVGESGGFPLSGLLPPYHHYFLRHLSDRNMPQLAIKPIRHTE
ncbi:MAG: hypothetical protein ACRCVV_20485 [Shewanella sp.]